MGITKKPNGEELETTPLDQGDGSVASKAELDSLVRAIADIVRSGGAGTPVSGFSSAAKAEIEAEVTDGIEADNLDHLLQIDGTAQKYPENCAADSIIAKMLCKGDPATPSSYDCTTDSQEALSDKLGTCATDLDTQVQAIQADIGDPSARTNLQTVIAMMGNPDVAGKTLYGNVGDFVGQTNLQTLLAALGIPDVAGKPLYTCMVTDRLDNGTYGLSAIKGYVDELDHLLKFDGSAQKYPENCATDSILAKMLVKADPAVPSAYNNSTDSLEMLSDKMGGFSGDGGAAQDDSVKASLDLAHTDLDAIIVQGTQAGTQIAITKVIAASAFNNTGIAFTQAAVGSLSIDRIILEPEIGVFTTMQNWAEVRATGQVYGQLPKARTIAAPVDGTTQDSIAGAGVMAMYGGLVENGDALELYGDQAAGGDAGNIKVTVILTRITAGAIIEATT